MPHSPLRILILDDCKGIADLMCLILNQSGYEARAVYSHARAIATAREFEPDVLLTGFVNDGEINGCETAAEVLTFLPQCHVIVFSGCAAAGPVLEEYRKRGYNFAVMAKPLHPYDLLAHLRPFGEPAVRLGEPPRVSGPRESVPPPVPPAPVRRPPRFMSLSRKSARR